MPVPGMEWLSRDELLDGLPARKASLVLFAIESRTAQLVARDQADAAPYLPPAVAEEREAAFMAALAAGRDLPLAPTIQQIERFAPHWATLAPEAPGVRAAVAHLLGEKYAFTQRDTPQLQVALGLATPVVQEAYTRFYQQPLDAIYKPQVALRQRLGWAWTGLAERIDTMPPFWLAFFLTLPGAAGLLAMPIVLANLGPLLGAGLLLLFGLINMLTAAAFAEASARSNTIHYGLGYIGQMAQEYLGNTGGLMATIVLALNNFVVLIIFYLGVGSTLEGATGVPTELWIAVVFAVGLYVLSRGSFNATVSSTLLVVLAIVLLMLLIPALVAPHVRMANLVAAAPPFAAQPFTWAALGPVFGVLSSTFLSHVVIPAYAPVVLRRDPGGRSLVQGSAAAILAFIVIACLWLLLIQGAVPPAVLRSAPGTVITPLATLVGPGINVLGAMLVVLSLGLACIQVSLGLYYLVQERLGAVSARGLSKRACFLLASSPIIVVFFVAEWLALNNIGSFANLLGILGALALPLIAGVIPLLLLLATRRKGDFTPARVYRWLGNPLIVGAIYLFFVGSIFLHGLLIWDDWATQLLALITGTLVVTATLVMLRRGILAPRLVVGLHDDRSLHGRSSFHVTCAGEPLVAALELGYPEGAQAVTASSGSLPDFARLRTVHTSLPSAPWRELKVWARRTTPELFTVNVAGSVALGGNGESATHDLEAAGGQVLVLRQEGMNEYPPGACNSCLRHDLVDSRFLMHKPPKILIVDDEPFNVDYLEQELDDLGYATVSAGDGQEALAQVAAESPDLILLDIMMPIMDGFQVLARLKGAPQWRDLPVIVISAMSDVKSTARGIELGAEDYLPKPFDPLLLRARIRASLDKKQLRDQEQELLRQVARLTDAAAAVEAGSFDPASLASLADRPDALGGLARVFRHMAEELATREERLQRAARQREEELQAQLHSLRSDFALAEPMLRQALDRTPPFDFLTAAEKSWLLGRIQLYRYPDGWVIADGKEADPDRLFMLVEGSVALFREGDAASSALIAAPAYFGERAIFLGKSPPHRLVAQGEVACAVLSGADVRRLAHENSQFSQAFATALRSKQRLFQGYEAFVNRLFMQMDAGLIQLRDMVTLYRDLNPILHAANHEQTLDLEALAYVIPRLPAGITATLAILLTEDMPEMYRPVRQLIRADSRRVKKREFYQVLPNKLLALLRDRTTDTVDLVTKLCIYAVETDKIRRRLLATPAAARHHSGRAGRR